LHSAKNGRLGDEQNLGTSRSAQVSNNQDTRVLEGNYMGFSMAGGGPLRAEINITPMIDVLLVLIIVFMVVVSMSQEKGLKAEIRRRGPSRRGQLSFRLAGPKTRSRQG
jgi:hypothetical protein